MTVRIRIPLVKLNGICPMCGDDEVSSSWCPLCEEDTEDSRLEPGFLIGAIRPKRDIPEAF